MKNFPWLKSYPDFVGHSTEINYQNIVEIYDQSIRNFGSKVAYKNMDVELTYNEIDDHVNSLIWYLQNKTNLKKGDKGFPVGKKVFIITTLLNFSGYSPKRLKPNTPPQS